MFTGIDAVTVIPRRRWTAVASFSVQAAVVAAALVLPLWHPTNLPEAFARRAIFLPVSQADVPPAQVNSPPQSGGSSLSIRPIIVHRDNGVHFGPPRPVVASNYAFPSLDPRLNIPGFTGPNAAWASTPAVHPILQKPPRVSVMMQGNLIHRVEPLYPPIAKMTGVQGVVLIKALISAGGRIEQAQVVSGSPLLSQAALEAIQQWKYRPYVLNGSAIEVETEITVSFVLQR